MVGVSLTTSSSSSLGGEKHPGGGGRHRGRGVGRCRILSVSGNEELVVAEEFNDSDASDEEIFESGEGVVKEEVEGEGDVGKGLGGEQARLEWTCKWDDRSVLRVLPLVRASGLRFELLSAMECVHFYLSKSFRY